MYLWGEVVSPEGCDYEDSRELGLCCIYCNQPVFLVKGKEYKNKFGTEVKVNPYFSHYQKTNEADLCEKRSLTKEGRELKELILGVPRGQRLQLFKEYYYDLLFTAAGYAIKAHFKKHKLSAKGITKNLHKALRASLTTECPADVTKFLTEYLNLSRDYIFEYCKEHSLNLSIQNRAILAEIIQYAAKDSTGRSLTALYLTGLVYHRIGLQTSSYYVSEYKKGLVELEELKDENQIAAKEGMFTSNLAIILLSNVDWVVLVEKFLDSKKRRNYVKPKGFG